MKGTGTRIITFSVKGMRMLTRTSFGSTTVFLYPVKKFSSSLISLILPLKAMKRHVKNIIILFTLFLIRYTSQGKEAFLTSVVFQEMHFYSNVYLDKCDLSKISDIDGSCSFLYQRLSYTVIFRELL